MNSLQSAYASLGKTCAEIASLVRMLDTCQSDAIVSSTVQTQLDAQMSQLEVHLSAARPAATA